MKRSKIVSVFLLGTLAGCWDTNPDDEQIVKEELRSTLAKECTIEADSDVDCTPPDGGHSEGTKQAYFSGVAANNAAVAANNAAVSANNNAFLWYWLGQQNSHTIYAPPPAAAYAPPPPSTARSGSGAAFKPSPALSARGGFGAGGAAHGGGGAS